MPDDTDTVQINLTTTQLSALWSTLALALQQTRLLYIDSTTLHITCHDQKTAGVIKTLIESATNTEQNFQNENSRWLLRENDISLTANTPKYLKGKLIARIINLSFAASTANKVQLHQHLLTIDRQTPQHISELTKSTRKTLIKIYSELEQANSTSKPECLQIASLLSTHNAKLLQQESRDIDTLKHDIQAYIESERSEKPPQTLIDMLSDISWDLDALQTKYIELSKLLPVLCLSLAKKPNMTQPLINLLKKIPAPYRLTCLYLCVLHYFKQKNTRIINTLCINNSGTLTLNDTMDPPTKMKIAEILACRNNTGNRTSEIDILQTINNDLIDYLHEKHGSHFPIIEFNTNNTYSEEKTRYHYHCGCYYLANDQYELASNYFDKYILTQPNNTNALAQRAFAYYKYGKIKLSENAPTGECLPSLLKCIELFEAANLGINAQEPTSKTLQDAYQQAITLMTGDTPKSAFKKALKKYNEKFQVGGSPLAVFGRAIAPLEPNKKKDLTNTP